MREPIWISGQETRFCRNYLVSEIIHEDQIAQHGGRAGLRDENLLSASLARPRHLYTYGEPTIFELAAAYGYGLAKNHPFVDGNKRTAFMVLYTFLGLNGYSLEVPEREVVGMMEGVAADEKSQDVLAGWLEVNSVNR